MSIIVGNICFLVVEVSFIALLPRGASRRCIPALRDELRTRRVASGFLRITRRAPRERWRWTGEEGDKLYLKSGTAVIYTCDPW